MYQIICQYYSPKKTKIGTLDHSKFCCSCVEHLRHHTQKISNHSVISEWPIQSRILSASLNVASIVSNLSLFSFVPIRSYVLLFLSIILYILFVLYSLKLASFNLFISGLNFYISLLLIEDPTVNHSATYGFYIKDYLLLLISETSR